MNVGNYNLYVNACMFVCLFVCMLIQILTLKLFCSQYFGLQNEKLSGQKDQKIGKFGQRPKLFC